MEKTGTERQGNAGKILGNGGTGKEKRSYNVRGKKAQ